MASDERVPCPVCGVPVEPGAGCCPNGHSASLPWEDTADVPFPEDAARHGDGAKQAAPPPPENTLFECPRCERLVETQYRQGAAVEPRYCPWCGRPVASILSRELDGYRIDQVLARGGFGVVYLTSNVAETKMKAVVKLLRPEMAYRQPGLVRVFVEEARLTEEIGQTCWNVVRVSNVRESPWPHFFMEYIRGTSLHKLIEEAGPARLPLADCKGYLRGIARAMQATHAHGRVHRDLKPLNIMVIQSREIERPEDRIKLLDFGLAMKIAGVKAKMRQLAESGSSTLSPALMSPVQSAGTPEYMPPEAFDGRNEFSGDIYSFGVTAYEVLTGKLPFETPSVDADRLLYWREVHKKTPPRSVRELRPETPAWLAKVVMRCLEKDTRKRVSSAEALLDGLREPLPKWVSLAAAGVVLLVAGLLFLVIRGPEPVPFGLQDWGVSPDDKSTPVPHFTPSVDSLILFVKDEEHLSKLKVHACVRGKVLTSVSADTSGVHASVVKDEEDLSKLKDDASVAGETLTRVEITFSPDPELLDLGRLIVITGEGKEGGKAFKFMGVIDIKHDSDPPVLVGPVQYDAGEGRRDMPREPGLRLGRGVKLVARIKEPHFHEVFLEIKCQGGRPAPPDLPVPILPGDDAPNEGGEAILCSLPLTADELKYRLEEGKCSCSVVAVDKATNRTESEPFTFEIDRDVAFLLDSAEEEFLAGGRAFYEFRAGDTGRGEPLAEIKFRRTGSPAWSDCDVYPRGEIEDSLDLARQLGDGTLERVSPTDLQSGERYLLAVPIGSQS